MSSFFAHACLGLTVSIASILVVQRATVSEGAEHLHPVHAAQNASAFIERLGVNVHLSYTSTPYGDLSQVKRQLGYLGLPNIRDNVSNGPQEFMALSTLAGLGYKIDMLANTSLSNFLTQARNLEAAHPGSVLAIEGLNEVNGWPPSYAGLTGVAAAIRHQKDLHASVKSDRLLNHVPVYNFTLADARPAAYRALGDLSAYADHGNFHDYYGGGQPAYGWSAGDSTFWWSSWQNTAQMPAPAKAVVVTETGATTAIKAKGYVGVDEATQAKQILNSLMDGAKYGNRAVFIYELVESVNNGPADRESHFGVFRWDGAPKPAATAIHNFIHILSDGGALTGTPGTLDYTIQGVPQWGGQMLYQEGDATMDIVVWAEPDIWNEGSRTPITAPNTPITIDLATAANVSIYDPMQSSTPVQSLGTTSHITFNVTDHPLIVEIRQASAH